MATFYWIFCGIFLIFCEAGTIFQYIFEIWDFSNTVSVDFLLYHLYQYGILSLLPQISYMLNYVMCLWLF